MTKPGSDKAENSPFFTCDLTPGELAMFDKIDREQAVHNALGAALGAYKDSIVKMRNEFTQELCRKYNIENPSKVTFDKRTRRFVSIFSADLMAVKIDRRPPSFDQAASQLTIGSIRELLAIYKAVIETRPDERT